MKDLFRLDGKVAIVTGGGSGLGKAMAQGFAHQGADVVIAEISPDTEKEVISLIEAEGREGMFIRSDASKLDDIDKVVDLTVKKFGRIDILVNNAYASKLRWALEVTEEEYNEILAVTLKGPYFFSQKVARVMVKQKFGSIINMTSIAATIGLPRGNSTYSAAKGGISSLTRVLAVEWAKYGIRVNAIAPCQFRTPVNQEKVLSNPQMLQQILKAIPLGRVGEEEDIIGPAVFLASDEAAMVTGHVLYVDGGVTIA